MLIKKRQNKNFSVPFFGTCHDNFTIIELKLILKMEENKPDTQPRGMPKSGRFWKDQKSR